MRRRLPTILATSVMLPSLGPTPPHENVKASNNISSKHRRISARLLKNQQDEWNKIMKLYGTGKQILIRLERNPSNGAFLRKRQQVFLEAAQKLKSWIGKYERDPNSLVYLRAHYRLGNYWEYAYEFENAEKSYRTCQGHPLLQSAQFDGQPLAPQLQSRLMEVSKNNRKKYSAPGFVVVQRRVGGGGKAGGRGRRLITEVVLDRSEPPKIVNDIDP